VAAKWLRFVAVENAGGACLRAMVYAGAAVKVAALRRAAWRGMPRRAYAAARARESMRKWRQRLRAATGPLLKAQRGVPRVSALR
jgi:hypothetical protein